MPAPSFTITVGDRGPASPAPDDVGTLFMVGVFDRGPVGTATESRSLARLKEQHGDVIATSHAIRSAEAYFREGGTLIRASRIVGPSATSASLDLDDSGGDPVVTLTAASPGDWAHDLQVTVTAATGDARNVTVTLDGDEVASGEVADEDELIALLESTGLVTVASGAGTYPPAAMTATALSGGSDDRANITETQVAAALDAFDIEDGPGSVIAPGDTDPDTHALLLAHAKEQNRFALLDAVDTPTVATLTAAAAGLRSREDAPYGQLLAPWERIPGPGGTTITIPPSGADAGRKARADRDNVAGPAQPAGASFGASRFSVDVTQTWTRAERDLLSEAGVTVVRLIKGVVQTYDGLTLADPETLPQYAEASGMRVVMAIRSLAEDILAARVLQVIDGKRHMLSALAADLEGVCQQWYQRDALYGATAAEAFSVDTGPGVNPDDQLAQRRIAAQIELRTSPFAATVSLLITKVAAGDRI